MSDCTGDLEQNSKTYLESKARNLSRLLVSFFFFLTYQQWQKYSALQFMPKVVKLQAVYPWGSVLMILSGIQKVKTIGITILRRFFFTLLAFALTVQKLWQSKCTSSHIIHCYTLSDRKILPKILPVSLNVFDTVKMMLLNFNSCCHKTGDTHKVLVLHSDV